MQYIYLIIIFVVAIYLIEHEHTKQLENTKRLLKDYMDSKLDAQELHYLDIINNLEQEIQELENSINKVKAV